MNGGRGLLFTVCYVTVDASFELFSSVEKKIHIWVNRKCKNTVSVIKFQIRIDPILLAHLAFPDLRGILCHLI